MRAAFVLKDRSDPELIAGIQAAVAREFEDVAVVVAHLAEMDQRELFKAEACSSLFKYCVEVLHLSESQAYLRIDVARIARKFPVVLDMLADGLVQLSAVHRLGPSLTGENHRDLLTEAVHKSKDKVEEIVARLRPKPAVPGTIRKLPSADPGAAEGGPEIGFFEGISRPDGSRSHLAQGADQEIPGSESSFPEGSDRDMVGSESSFREDSVRAACPGSARSAASQKSSVSPLAPEIYKIQCTINAKTRRKLIQLQEMMSHRVPDGDVGKIIGLAIDLLFDEVSRTTFGNVKHPRRTGKDNGSSSDETNGSRHIPADVKRAVWQRDQGRCAFVSKSGRQCTERSRIEYHHVVPFAWGGESTIQNIQLRCRTHNAYEGEIIFGRVARRNRRKPRRTGLPTGSGTSSAPANGVISSGPSSRHSGPTGSGTSSRDGDSTGSGTSSTGGGSTGSKTS